MRKAIGLIITSIILSAAGWVILIAGLASGNWNPWSLAFAVVTTWITSGVVGFCGGFMAAEEFEKEQQKQRMQRIEEILQHSDRVWNQTTH